MTKRLKDTFKRMDDAVECANCEMRREAIRMLADKKFLERLTGACELYTKCADCPMNDFGCKDLCPVVTQLERSEKFIERTERFLDKHISSLTDMLVNWTKHQKAREFAPRREDDWDDEDDEDDEDDDDDDDDDEDDEDDATPLRPRKLRRFGAEVTV